MLRRFATWTFLSLYFIQVHAQSLECIGFYNLENLFDTVDDTMINDEEYLPSSGWTVERYQKKLDNMATVIAQLCGETMLKGPAFLGVSEVENKGVLQDLVDHPRLRALGYDILHFDSPDRRGIDVAALYQKHRFIPMSTHIFPLHIYGDDGEKKYTRDILYVFGLLDGEPVHLTINHWPSRRGGAKATDPYRRQAARINRSIYDSLRVIDPEVKFILMGDLNDNPNNKSLTKELMTQKKLTNRSGDLYNPFCSFYKKGMGSNAWDDTWSNFDQIVISSSFENPTQGWAFQKAKIFKKPFMLQSSGRFKGYPLRTQAGGQFLGGYSDHFPVLLYLAR